MNSLSKFAKYVADGLISRKVSPCGRLVLFDYTEKTQWEKAWDEVTLNARGTVYELSTGAIVAQSFPKFFNFSELTLEKQSQLLAQKFSVQEKMDGSLGIVYFYDNEWHVNTRGSFVSDQAVKGLEMLQKLEKQFLIPGVTYLVEIIYPENRIVVDYSGEEKLVLLSAFNKSGSELPIGGTVFKHKAKEYTLSSVPEILAKLKELSFNEEGYVVRFQDGTRVKFKGEEYVKMHRIISGMSPLVLWESMKDGKVSTELLASIPEEFREQYEKMAADLELKYWGQKEQIDVYMSFLLGNICVEEGVTPENRKALGLYLKNNDSELAPFVFPAFLGKGLDEMIKREIRPTGNVI